MNQVSLTIKELIEHLRSFPDQSVEVFVVNEHYEALPITQIAESRVCVDGDTEDRPCLLIIPTGAPSADELAGLADPN